jgi:hypothetical protein
MKNKIKWLFIFIVVPIIIFAQDDSPPPFDDIPPDYEPELNIDNPIGLIVMITFFMILYFLILQKKIRKYHEK